MQQLSGQDSGRHLFAGLPLPACGAMQRAEAKAAPRLPKSNTVSAEVHATFAVLVMCTC